MEVERNSVITLYLAGKPQVAVVRALQHLNVNKSFVSRTIACYRVTSSVASRSKSERKKRKIIPEMIRKVKTRFDRNPRRIGRKIARELNVTREQMQQIFKNLLELKPLKFQIEQELIDGKKLD